jgi:hypothetical protein
MSGVSDAILEELLAVAKTQNVNLAAMVKSMNATSFGNNSSGGGFAGVAAGLGKVSVASVGASLAFGALQVAGNFVSGVLSTLGTIVGGIIGTFSNLVTSMYNLGKATALAGTKLSEFYDAFKGIPLLGNLFGLLGDYTRYQEGLLNTFQQISKNGALFSGSLTDMKASASKAFLGIEEFGQVVKENSEIFATMGTATTGVRKFVEIQNKLLTGEYGDSIRGLGFTAKDTAELIASYGRSQGTMNKQGMQNTAEVTKSVAAYAAELSTLSQLTGESNEEIRKKLEKDQQDAVYQNFLSNLKKEEADVITAAVAARNQAQGAESAQSLRNAFMGLNAILTPAQGALQQMTGGLLLANNAATVDAAKRGSTMEQIRNLELKQSQESAGIVRKNLIIFGATGAALRDDIISQAVGTIVKFGITQENVEKNVKTAAQESAKTKKSEAQALETAQQRVRAFGESMMNLVYGVIAPFVPTLQQLANFAKDLVVGFLDLTASIVGSKGFKDSVKDVTNWFSNTFNDLKNSYKEGGFKALLTTLFAKIKEAFTGAANSDLWNKTLKPALVEVWDNVLKPAFIGLMDLMWGAFKEWLFGGPSAAELREKGQTKKDEKVQGKVNDASWKDAATMELMKKYGEDPILKSKIGSGDFERDVMKRVEELKAEAAAAAAKNNSATPVKKHSGTLGTTGNWWEKSDVVAEIQQGESVVTQSQMEQIVGTASQSGLAQSIQQLNSLTAQMLTQMKQTAEYTRRNYDATRALGGNLFEAA